MALYYKLINLIFYRPAPKNEDEMMVAIFECIDRLFRIVRPRKLLYMAIDGVVRIFYTNQLLLLIVLSMHSLLFFFYPFEQTYNFSYMLFLG